MKTDEIIDWVDILETENKTLRLKNKHLYQQIRRLRDSLESALNMLDPEQLRIIHKDIYDFN